MPDALCPGTPNLLWNRDLAEQGHHRTKGSLNIMSLTNPPVPLQANSGRLKFFTFSHSDCFCPRDHETSEQTDPDEFKQKTKASVWKHNTWPLHEVPKRPGGLAEKENLKLWEATSEKGACPLPGDKTASNTIIWLTGPSARGRLRNCLLSHTRIHKQSLLGIKWDPGQKSLSPCSSVAFCTLSRSAFWVVSLSSVCVDDCPCLSWQHYKPQEDRVDSATPRGGNQAYLFECYGPFSEGSWVAI